MLLSVIRKVFPASMFLVFFLNSTGCGIRSLVPRADADDPANLNLLDSRSQVASHLIFATVNPSASPWSSAVYQLSLSSQDVKSINLSGESSDPALFPNGGQVLFFNRSSGSENFRRIGFESGAALAGATDQQKFPGGAVGDPHDVLMIPGGQMLLAHYNEGTLTVAKVSDGSLVQTLAADWDLPEGVTLRPEALVAVRGAAGENFIYVIHQALSFRNGLLGANGSQAVFVLKITDDRIEAFDLEEATPRIQGIKTKGSFPVLVRSAGREKPLLVSMCSLYVDTSATAAAPCVNSVEEIDPATHRTNELWDLAGQNLFMNGGVTSGPDENTFFANVVSKVSEVSSETIVAAVNIGSKTFTTKYKFAPESGGYWGTFYDHGRKTLYVGDQGHSSIGRFIALKEGEPEREISLGGVPYSGAFLFAAP